MEALKRRSHTEIEILLPFPLAVLSAGAQLLPSSFQLVVLSMLIAIMGGEETDRPLDGRLRIKRLSKIGSDF
jgi:hypothetical protein